MATISMFYGILIMMYFYDNKNIIARIFTQNLEIAKQPLELRMVLFLEEVYHHPR